MKRLTMLVTVVVFMAATMMALAGAALAQEDRGGADVCVSQDGQTIYDSGPSFCRSGATSQAVAVNNSEAEAGRNSTAVAVNDSFTNPFDNSEGVAVNNSFAGADTDSEAYALDHCVATAFHGEEEVCF